MFSLLETKVQFCVTLLRTTRKLVYVAIIVCIRWTYIFVRSFIFMQMQENIQIAKLYEGRQASRFVVHVFLHVRCFQFLIIQLAEQ